MPKPSAQIVQHLEKLRRELREHDYRYYVLNAPSIGDEHYDTLMKELQDVERKYPELVTPDSPTQRIGGQPIKEFATVTHNPPMLSLANSYSETDIRDFDRRVRELLDKQTPTYVAELKFDGVAVSLEYRDGVFVKGATRGDGTRGDDITQNLRTVRTLPLHLRTKDTTLMNIVVRGETYMERKDFEQLNKQQVEVGGKVFINPRNTTAGTLKLQDPKIVAGRPLKMFAYALFARDAVLTSHDQNLQTLKRLGLPVSEHARRCKDIDQVIEYWKEWEGKRDTLPYDIDGIVAKVDLLHQHDLLGNVAKSPRWAIAFKFASRKAETLLNGITLQVGRIGTITPVAELEPVFLGGTTVSRATLHNTDYINELDLRIGDTVTVEKGGDVIPKVSGIVESKRPRGTTPFVMPKQCPECGSRIYRPEGEASYFCENTQCPAQVRARVEHFAQRGAMDIDGLGEAAVGQLVGLALVKSYADLYFLHEHKQTLVDLDRWGERSTQNLLDAIGKSRKHPFHRVLFALGIRHVGQGVAQVIAESFPSIDLLRHAKEEELQSTSGIGPKIAESIVHFFTEKHNREIIKRLRDAGVSLEGSPRKPTGKLAGKVFVLTGALTSFRREEARRLIEERGGKVASSVSKKVTHVLAGEDAGSKLQDARQLGTRIISEEEFKTMIK
jgi:DNA ligase (NAD+)